MKRIHPHTLGLVLGTFLASWHTVWALLIRFGVAQSFINFVFKLHMIVPPYRIAPFRLDLTLGLIALTAGIGYILGWIIGMIWNRYVGK